jgi:hypothetical protein
VVVAAAVVEVVVEVEVAVSASGNLAGVLVARRAAIAVGDPLTE